jgi:hypothetical protein
VVNAGLIKATLEQLYARLLKRIEFGGDEIPVPR